MASVTMPNKPKSVPAVAHAQTGTNFAPKQGLVFDTIYIRQTFDTNISLAHVLNDTRLKV